MPVAKNVMSNFAMNRTVAEKKIKKKKRKNRPSNKCAIE